MARAKSLASRRHKKIRKAAKGFMHARSRRVKAAKEAVLHAGQYAYIGRKLKKRDLRSLWILRINAASREAGMKYSDFIKGLKTKKIELNRKMLADIAVRDMKTFRQIVDLIRK